MDVAYLNQAPTSTRVGKKQVPNGVLSQRAIKACTATDSGGVARTFPASNGHGNRGTLDAIVCTLTLALALSFALAFAPAHTAPASKRGLTGSRMSVGTRSDLKRERKHFPAWQTVLCQVRFLARSKPKPT